MARNAVWDESSGAWISPQADPYALKNFQQASANLAQGRSALARTRAESIAPAVQREMAAAEALQATHYALKVWPRTEEERDALEFDADLDVIYEPFDYQRLPEEWTPKLQKTRAANALPDERKYTVVHTGYEDEAGNFIDSITITLPVLYIVWPVDKPIPGELDHQVLYETYLPHKLPATRSTGISAEATRALEQEAVFLATAADVTGSLTGNVSRQDSELNTPEPMDDLRIQIRSGSSIYETHTDHYGGFHFRGFTFPATASLNLVFMKDRHWRITRHNQGTNPITETKGYLADFTYSDTQQAYRYDCLLTDNGQLFNDARYEIHRAVAFYFNGARDQRYSGSKMLYHEIPAYSYNDAPAFEIEAYGAMIEPNIYGRFTYFPGILGKRAFIKISNAYRTEHPKLMGTVFHELGHWTHYCIKGGTGPFNNTSDWIAENWAPFVGWYLGETYYESQGWTKVYPYWSGALTDTEGSITRQAEQSWNTSMSRETYGPRFVDLVDDYNQSILGPTYPNDAIKNVPISVLLRLLETNKWSSFKSTLDNYIGIYFTREEFDNYCKFWN